MSVLVFVMYFILGLDGLEGTRYSHNEWGKRKTDRPPVRGEPVEVENQ